MKAPTPFYAALLLANCDLRTRRGIAERSQSLYIPGRSKLAVLAALSLWSSVPKGHNLDGIANRDGISMGLQWLARKFSARD